MPSKRPVMEQTEKLHGEPTAGISPDVLAVEDLDRTALRQYWERAVFMFQNARAPEFEPRLHSMFLAFSVHACQSMIEGLEQIARAEAQQPNWAEKLDGLPFTNVLCLVRNHDLHGNPIPVCRPNRTGMMMQSGKKPMRLTSSHGVAVTLRRFAPAKVHLSPKSQAYGGFGPGDAISYFCDKGVIWVTNPTTGKAVTLVTAIEKQLKALEPIVAEVLNPPEIIVAATDRTDATSEGEPVSPEDQVGTT